MQYSFALGVSYTGTRYHGWQYQSADTPTVQMALEQALSVVAAANIRVTCAGRTDSGVHATGQVVNFVSPVNRPLKAWVMGANANLPDDISVTWAVPVKPEFSARHTATARRYIYLIHQSRTRSAIFSGMLTRDHRTLDASLMHDAGQALLGENDFSSFRAANCQSSTPMRNIHHVTVHTRHDMLVIDIQANAFLHHMVRNIAGTLANIGAGEQPTSWMTDLLDLKDRTRAGITAPPHGLYLVDVQYPAGAGIPPGPSLPHMMASLLP